MSDNKKSVPRSKEELEKAIETGVTSRQALNGVKGDKKPAKKDDGKKK